MKSSHTTNRHKIQHADIVSRVNINTNTKEKEKEEKEKELIVVV